MGKSRRIIKNLCDSIESYLDDPQVTYEHYKELPDDLEERQVGIRIALYSEEETVSVKVGAEKPADSRQRLGIDISIDRGYRHDDATHGELPVLDYKDQIIDWINQLDAYVATEGAIQSLGYEGSSGFIRRKRYITLTLRLSGRRDLISTQKE